MKIVFLDAAKLDLRRFKRHCTTIFPEGRRNADQQYRALLKLLKSCPMIGEPADDFRTAREHPVKNTPFTVIYRIRPEHIEILRLPDQRSRFSNHRKR